MSSLLKEKLALGQVLLSDGAMGTLLQQRGLQPGQAPEAMNLDHPEMLAEIAAAFVAAGSDLVHTNSFGGSPLKLAAHGLAAQAEAINRTAAQAAVKGAAGKAIVSGSVGPCGKLLQPYGEADPQLVKEGFLLQARALLAGGAQALTIETMSDVTEAVLAVTAARQAGPEVPILATMTFDPSPRGWFTIMGQDIPTVAAALEEAGADLVGANCGQGPAGLLEVARDFAAACDLPLMIQANAGLPELRDGQVVYPTTPDEMAAFLPELLAARVRVVGGCCGTTFEHIAALRRALDSRESPG